MASKDRRQCCGKRTTFIGVVWKPFRHQRCAKVCVADTEFTICSSVLVDCFGRILAIADQDLLCEEHDLGGVLVCINVVAAIVAQELEQVKAREVTCRVVEVHVLGAWV